ncbi:phospholipase-like protein [Tanacetum coccineum]
MILDQSFAQLYDDDAVGLCCLGILQLVILGVDSRHVVPGWILRLANDRVAWNKYPWGSYVWPTLYSQLCKRQTLVALGGPSSFQGHVNSSYFNMGTPPNFQTPMSSQPGSSDWQRQMSAQSATQYWQPGTSSQPGCYYSFGQVPSHMGRPNLQTTIETHHDVDGIFDQLMIRRRPLNANWTVAYTSTISVHPENNQFIILKDPHVIGTLDGSTRPYPSWNDVDWVFLPIHVAGNHWATGVIHLANSHFYVFDSMFIEENNNVISQLIECWTPVLNHILEERGCLNETRRPHNFQYSYNQGLDIYVPQQTNLSDCGVITCWLIYSLCSQRKPVVQGNTQQFFENFRNEMCTRFYRSRCEDTRDCGYD